MNLKEYLFYYNVPVAKMAEEIQISRTYLSHLLNGDKKVSKKLAKNIVKATNGIVKENMILGPYTHQNFVKTTKPLPDGISNHSPALLERKWISREEAEEFLPNKDVK